MGRHPYATEPEETARLEAGTPVDDEPANGGEPTKVTGVPPKAASSVPQEAKTTIRARIMWAMVLVAGIALATSGAIVAVLQDRHIQVTAKEQLHRAHIELRFLATEGINPKTQTRFSNPSDVMRTYMSRGVVSLAEGEVGFLGSSIHLLSAVDVQIRPEKDEELLRATAGLVTGDKTVFTTVRTSQRTYQVLVAPLIYPNERGALLRVIDLDVAAKELRHTMTLYAVVAALTVALVVCLAWIAVGRLLRPIEQLRVATESIGEHDLTSRVPVRGKDDLTALASAVNRMLDRVQRSVEGQRDLLDDVSHELRTPITVVRGHLELIDPEDPLDVRQTRDLAIDELDRMGVLVNDLLLLAKSTDSDFVKPVPYDVAALTDQVLEKARALGERRWHLERLAPIRAELDPARITQAWLQLAANAVKYSEPGTTVGIGSQLVDGEVRMWVRDEGIGIAAEDLPRVRQRFRRTGEAVRRAGGSGLGLSIVESIVTAHGGSLDIESTLGEGSLFVLRVPLWSGEMGPDTKSEE